MNSTDQEIVTTGGWRPRAKLSQQKESTKNCASQMKFFIFCLHLRTYLCLKFFFSQPQILKDPEKEWWRSRCGFSWSFYSTYNGRTRALSRCLCWFRYWLAWFYKSADILVSGLGVQIKIKIFVIIFLIFVKIYFNYSKKIISNKNKNFCDFFF